MLTRIRRRVAATVAALGLVGMSFTVGSGSSVAAGQPFHPVQTSSVCSTPADQVTLTSVDQVAGLIAGTWIRCDGPPLFGDGSPGEVGVDVVGGRFYRLYSADDGSLIRAEGVDQEGTLAILDTTSMNGPGSYQSNWKLLGQGTAIFTPSFFRTPSVMGLTGMSGASHYERWTGAAPTTGAPPGTIPSACGNRVTPIELTSVAQVQDLLVGTWTHCAGGSAIGNAEGEAGLEFTSDGRFRRLADHRWNRRARQWRRPGRQLDGDRRNGHERTGLVPSQPRGRWTGDLPFVLDLLRDVTDDGPVHGDAGTGGLCRGSASERCAEQPAVAGRAAADR